MILNAAVVALTLSVAENYFTKLQSKYKNPIVTELKAAKIFWPAEDYHQQYLHDNPNGYCMHWNLGVNFELSDLD